MTTENKTPEIPPVPPTEPVAVAPVVPAPAPAVEDDDPDFPILDTEEKPAEIPPAPVAETKAEEPPAAKVEPEPEPAPVVEPEPPAPVKPAETPESVTAATKEFYLQVTEHAKKRVEAVFGESYDPFNESHIAALGEESRRIIARIDDERNSKSRIDAATDAVAKELAAQATPELTPAAIAEAVQDLPYREYAKIERAYNAGDPGPMIAAIRKAVTAKKASAKAGTIATGAAPTPKKKEEPIALMGGGVAAVADADTMDGFNL